MRCRSDNNDYVSNLICTSGRELDGQYDRWTGLVAGAGAGLRNGVPERNGRRNRRERRKEGEGEKEEGEEKQ
jgi:hypothetical protein